MNRQIILDTETTGLDRKSGHRIIEIGCVEIVNRKYTGKEFHVYINPERDSDPGALEVHGLTTEFLSDKPKFAEIYEEFIEFVKDAELLIHNAEFDIGFLNHEIKLISKKLNSVDKHVSAITDTLQIAREKHPGQRNSLDALVNRYEVGGYDRELHGALLDSKILGDVYLAMTGGQSNLDFTNQNNAQNQVDESVSYEHVDLNLTIAKVSEEEHKSHLEYLQRMEDETGVKPVWLLKDSK
tara:strand:+ start:93 stop:812 length:720 start_codon:yes stop_codon:yes gene_type:complete